jgi:hypothetical protein
MPSAVVNRSLHVLEAIQKAIVLQEALTERVVIDRERT